MGLYRDSDLGIFWWVCDLVLGGGFVIWFWMGVVCGGFARGGDCGGFFFFSLYGWWRCVEVEVEVEVEVSFCCDFFSFFVSGGYGMGGGFLVGGW